jgi:hypothetical protein
MKPEVLVEALRRHLSATSCGKKWCAWQLGVTYQAMWLWLRAETLPSQKNCLRLEAWLRKNNTMYLNETVIGERDEQL